MQKCQEECLMLVHIVTGLTGKEIDSTIYGQGNEYDYGFRIYDPRLGRFLHRSAVKKLSRLESHPFCNE